jgi:hypothetical protein
MPELRLGLNDKVMFEAGADLFQFLLCTILQEVLMIPDREACGV